MAAIIEQVDKYLIIGEPDNGLGSRIHTGASELGEADIAQAAFMEKKLNLILIEQYIKIRRLDLLINF